ncbi:MAG: DUF4160 domain-containing protein [Ardenticatenaceae bacterium]
MPTVKRIRNYRFYFWSREERRRHIHIDSADGTAKFWLEPDVELADFYNMKAKELRKLERLVRTYQDELTNAWNDYFLR